MYIDSVLLKSIYNDYISDCGAGIGRVSKRLLLPLFNTVDIEEQNPAFLKKAEEYLVKWHISLWYLVTMDLFQEDTKLIIIRKAAWPIIIISDNNTENHCIVFFHKWNGSLAHCTRMWSRMVFSL